ncbi:hypothetical protein KCP77_24645 (plasmid) [Salmonella enterica subsp. enterica]|nr:hypothetical protein KCP77_24645 [Salmonella enterica subsp. enterica]
MLPGLLRDLVRAPRTTSPPTMAFCWRCMRWCDCLRTCAGRAVGSFRAAAGQRSISLAACYRLRHRLATTPFTLGFSISGSWPGIARRRLGAVAGAYIAPISLMAMSARAALRLHERLFRVRDGRGTQQ